ncbi:hypothetical protein VNO77_29492 [Canavalia gladiata]|uniref:Uncharacterized protein n=1 Tax=Canavalia gladiata TaxID=3824 RepID=A0AAN9KWS6_CANGL
MRELSQTSGYPEGIIEEAGSCSQCLWGWNHLNCYKTDQQVVIKAFESRNGEFNIITNAQKLEEHGVESEATQVKFIEGGTNVQCLKSDKRVTPSGFSAETIWNKEEKRKSRRRNSYT